MFQQLQKYDNWEYSSKVWYEKYHIAIEIGYASRAGLVRIPTIPLDVECRTRARRTNKGVITTVYTDNVDYALDVITSHPGRIISIRSPINESHLETLQQPDRRVEVRDSLYHGCYRFKVHTLKNYKRGFDRLFWHEKCQEINQWIDENFTDSRTQRQVGWGFFSWSQWGNLHDDVKFVYTNDELQLMLYKMAFGNDFHIEITHAFMPQDFTSV